MQKILEWNSQFNAFPKDPPRCNHEVLIGFKELPFNFDYVA